MKQTNKQNWEAYLKLNCKKEGNNKNTIELTYTKKKIGNDNLILKMNDVTDWYQITNFN